MVERVLPKGLNSEGVVEERQAQFPTSAPPSRERLQDATPSNHSGCVVLRVVVFHDGVGVGG